MTWRELKDRIEEMTPEEQDKAVIGWGEDTPIKDVVLAKLDENLYYNENWDCCLYNSDCEPEDLIDPETYLVAKKGLYYLEF